MEHDHGAQRHLHAPEHGHRQPRPHGHQRASHDHGEQRRTHDERARPLDRSHALGRRRHPRRQRLGQRDLGQLRAEWWAYNDQVVATTTKPTNYGWVVPWNTTTVPNGTYTLQSVASYAGGLSGTSAPITITVSNAAPTTSVLVPSTGATLSGGAATLDANASANVTSVSFELSGGAYNDQVVATTTKPTNYGWVVPWNTTTVPNGTYTLQSVASYAGGLSGTSAPITITLSNAAPTTSVLVPSTGATLSGLSATLDANASTNVTTVSFELSGGAYNDQVISGSTQTMYGWIGPWNTTTVPDGTYTLQSVATYASGQSATSAPITITVNNPTPTTSVLVPRPGPPSPAVPPPLTPTPRPT